VTNDKENQKSNLKSQKHKLKIKDGERCYNLEQVLPLTLISPTRGEKYQ
jgi:hypothetical protein